MNEENEYLEPTDPTAEAMQAEADFSEFYIGIIFKLYDLKSRKTSEEVKWALRNIRKFKDKTKVTQEILSAQNFSYESYQMRCAHLYAYSVLHSIMAYFEFSDLLYRNKKLLLPVCQRDSLKICCFGGGPGTEAVAICRSINDIILRSCPKSATSVLKVHVTVIDKLHHWTKEESEMMNAVNNRSNVLHSKRIVLNSDFMKADLLKPFDRNLKKKLWKADIVTIFKVGASVQEQKKDPGSCITELQNMMSSITESMREDSFLFMLDNAGGSVFYKMKRVLQDKKHPSLLKSSSHKEYVLDENTVSKFENLLNSAKEILYTIPPTRKGKISSCMWIKNSNSFTKKNIASSNQIEKTSDNRNTTSSMSEREKRDDIGMPYNMISALVGRSKVSQYATKTKNEEQEKENKRLKKKKNNNTIKDEYCFGDVNVVLEVNVETSKGVWIQKI